MCCKNAQKKIMPTHKLKIRNCSSITFVTSLTQKSNLSSRILGKSGPDSTHLIYLCKLVTSAELKPQNLLPGRVSQNVEKNFRKAGQPDPDSYLSHLSKLVTSVELKSQKLLPEDELARMLKGI
jgi:hypothetical protein